MKASQVKNLSKQVSDIQTTIDVQFGDKSPFHLKVKELQAEIYGIPRLPDESPQLKRKFDEVQKMLKTCASFCRTPAASSFGFSSARCRQTAYLGPLLRMRDSRAQVNVVEFSSTAKGLLKSEYLKFRDRCSTAPGLMLLCLFMWWRLQDHHYVHPMAAGAHVLPC